MILHKNYDWLYEKYINDKLSSVKIGNLCNINPQTIRYWLKKFEIPIRSMSEAANSGEKHWNYGNKKENSYSWKGDKANYAAVHVLGRKYLPKTYICAICEEPGNYDKKTNSQKLYLVNKTGKRIRDINNFMWGHSTCHFHYDKDNNLPKHGSMTWDKLIK